MENGQQQQLYAIERLVDKRYNVAKRRIEYRARWEGYGPEDDTWESALRMVMEW